MRQKEAVGAAIGGTLLFCAAIRLESSAAELSRLAILGTTLGVLTSIDLAERRVPNRIVVPASVACAALLSVGEVHASPLLGGLAIVALMLSLALISPVSFGMGDVKLALLIVLGLGPLAAEGLVAGLVLAATFGVVLLWRHGRSAATRSLPLAPFLSSGAALVVLL